MTADSPHKSARRSMAKKERDFTLKDIEKMKAENRLKIKEKNDVVTREDRAKEETGQNALRLATKFHEKLLFIKKHLESKLHPISQIISKFKEVYSCQYYFLMMRDNNVYLTNVNAKKATNMKFDVKN